MNTNNERMQDIVRIMLGTECKIPIADWIQGFNDDASQYGLNVSDNRMAGII